MLLIENFTNSSFANSNLTVCEIFYSIQGEGTRAGFPCVFIRLAGCNLNCSWCDTVYANSEKDGCLMTVEQISEKISQFDCDFITITGGEPLLQNRTVELTNELLNLGKTVAIETNGSLSVENIDNRAIKIIDVKCPDSKMSEQNNFENFQYLTTNDEIKFVVASKKDFIWSCEIIEKYKLFNKTKNLLFSAVTKFISHQELATLILDCKNSDYKNIIRLQIQIHKIIWSPNQRGV